MALLAHRIPLSRRDSTGGKHRPIPSGPVPQSKAKTVWVSAQGMKHRIDTATGSTACGLEFTEPWPACVRTDPMCKTCTRGMR